MSTALKINEFLNSFFKSSLKDSDEELYKSIQDEFIRQQNHFELIQLSKLNLEDEIKIFNDAEIVVGLQGAGFTNLIWSNNKTKIIELRSKRTNKLYQNLAKQNKINFNFIESEPIGSTIAKHYGAININLEELKKLI